MSLSKATFAFALHILIAVLSFGVGGCSSQEAKSIKLEEPVLKVGSRLFSRNDASELGVVVKIEDKHPWPNQFFTKSAKVRFVAADDSIHEDWYTCDTLDACYFIQTAR